MNLDDQSQPSRPSTLSHRTSALKVPLMYHLKSMRSSMSPIFLYQFRLEGSRRILLNATNHSSPYICELLHRKY